MIINSLKILKFNVTVQSSYSGNKCFIVQKNKLSLYILTQVLFCVNYIFTFKVINIVHAIDVIYEAYIHLCPSLMKARVGHILFRCDVTCMCAYYVAGPLLRYRQHSSYKKLNYSMPLTYCKSLKFMVKLSLDHALVQDQRNTNHRMLKVYTYAVLEKHLPNLTGVDETLQAEESTFYLLQTLTKFLVTASLNDSSILLQLCEITPDLLCKKCPNKTTTNNLAAACLF